MQGDEFPIRIHAEQNLSVDPSSVRHEQGYNLVYQGFLPVCLSLAWLVGFKVAVNAQVNDFSSRYMIINHKFSLLFNSSTQSHSRLKGYR